MKVSNVIKLSIADRRLKVTEYVLKRESYQVIADKLGVSKRTIIRDVKAIHKIWQKESIDNIDELRLRDLAELDNMEMMCALEYETNKSSTLLLRRIQIKERRAKLMGMDKPTRNIITGKDEEPLFGPNLSGLTTEQLVKLSKIADGVETDK